MTIAERRGAMTEPHFHDPIRPPSHPAAIEPTRLDLHPPSHYPPPQPSRYPAASSAQPGYYSAAPPAQPSSYPASLPGQAGNYPGASAPPAYYPAPQAYGVVSTPPGSAVQAYVPGYPAVQAPVGRLGFHVVSAGGRLGAVLLDTVLIMVTFGIGWLIWSVITWSDGQTPAKKLLGHVVADAHSGAAFDWGRMALREFCVKGLLGWVLNLVTLGIYFWIDAFMCLGDRQRTLHDRMANSIVRFR